MVFTTERKASLDGNAQQWKEMMLHAISEREKAEHDKQVHTQCSKRACFDIGYQKLGNLSVSYQSSSDRASKVEGCYTNVKITPLFWCLELNVVEFQQA